MYEVYFQIYHGDPISGNPTHHLAGRFDDEDSAIDCAKKCYGYVQFRGRVIHSFVIN